VSRPPSRSVVALARALGRRFARPAGVGGSGFLIQGDIARMPIDHRPDPSPMYAVYGIAIALVAVILLKLTVIWLPKLCRLLGARRRRTRRMRAAATAEARARSLMSELCPHGWRAQITLFGPGDEMPPDAPGGNRALVALDWAELEEERGRVAVVRRVWAPTIGDALEAMIADRRTDETLEQIEQSAVADGTLWPDL
jgi:hypothetical protein